MREFVLHMELSHGFTLPKQDTYTMATKAIDLVPLWAFHANTNPEAVTDWVETGTPRRAAQWFYRTQCWYLPEIAKKLDVSSGLIFDLVEARKLPRPVRGFAEHKWWWHGIYNASRPILRGMRMRGELAWPAS